MATSAFLQSLVQVEMLLQAEGISGFSSEQNIPRHLSEHTRGSPYGWSNCTITFPIGILCVIEVDATPVSPEITSSSSVVSR